MARCRPPVATRAKASRTPFRGVLACASSRTGVLRSAPVGRSGACAARRSNRSYPVPRVCARSVCAGRWPLSTSSSREANQKGGWCSRSRAAAARSADGEGRREAVPGRRPSGRRESRRPGGPPRAGPRRATVPRADPVRPCAAVELAGPGPGPSPPSASDGSRGAPPCRGTWGNRVPAPPGAVVGADCGVPPSDPSPRSRALASSSAGPPGPPCRGTRGRTATPGRRGGAVSALVSPPGVASAVRRCERGPPSVDSACRVPGTGGASTGVGDADDAAEADASSGVEAAAGLAVEAADDGVAGAGAGAGMGVGVDGLVTGSPVLEARGGGRAFLPGGSFPCSIGRDHVLAMSNRTQESVGGRPHRFG